MDIQPPPTVPPSSLKENKENVVIVDSQFTPPWPDWKDEEVNTENWMDSEGAENGFIDPSGTILPFNLPVEWVRPADIFSQPPPIVLGGQSTIDLISPNAHLCEMSEVIRFILSDISELYELSLEEDFDCEGENGAYIPNSDHPWRPWNHIYSLCSAGVKGSKPLFNPSGRYLVRLYYMGSWRRITVDDRIPLLSHGIFGLPMTNSFELWPMLLTKALLKIASLSWDDPASPNSLGGGGGDQNHFSTISCLTGFIGCHWNIVNPVDDQGLWLYLNNVLPKYKRPQFPRRSRKNRHRVQQDTDIVDSIFSLHPVPPTSASEPEKADDQKTKSVDRKKRGRKKKKKDKLLTGGETSTMEESVTDAASVDEKRKKKSSKRRKKSLTIKDATTSEDENKKNKPIGSRKSGRKNKRGKETEDDHVSDDNQKKKKKKKPKKGKQKKEKPPLFPSTTTENEEGTEEEEETEFEGECEPNVFDLVNNPEIESEKLSSATNLLRQQKLGHCNNYKEPPPSMQEIVRGVQQYFGPLVQSSMSNLDKDLGQDDPITVTAFFRHFPQDEDDRAKVIPHFLHYHPVQLAEVRDEPAYKESCRPPTPLWKTYRWKEWAMKKGLIPMDSSFNSQKRIQSVLAKTPIPLKSDWHHRVYSLEEYKEEKSLDDDYPFQLPPAPFKISSGVTMDEVKRLRVPKNKSPPAPPQSVVTPLKEVVRMGSQKKGQKGQRNDDDDDNESKSLSQLGQQGSTTRSIESIKKDDQKLKKLNKPTRDTKSMDGKSRKSDEDNNKTDEEPSSSATERSKSSKKKNSRKKSKRKKEKSSDDGQTTQNEDQDDRPTTTEEGKKGGKSRKKKKDKSKNKLDKKFNQNSTKVIPISENVTTAAGTGNDELSSSGKETLLLPTLPPSQACQNLWIDVEDVAKNLVKFSKFYSAKNEFGSHYVLRRNPKKVATFMTIPDGHHHHHNLTKSDENEDEQKIVEVNQKEDEEGYSLPVTGSSRILKDFNNEPGSLNVTIRLGRGHEIDVKDWHMNNIDDLDSGFYLFSDSWTQQELIFTLDVLLESTVLKFTHHKNSETKPEKRPITVIVKPWDWRHDSCMEGNVIVISSNQSCLTHLPLPPGRHLFRIWLLDESSEVGSGSGDGTSGIGHQLLKKMDPDSHFSLKILSQCPIHLGNRVEAQNLMTNQPVQFLRQADLLTRSIWALLLSFGHKWPIVKKSLKNLYQSYCPTYDEPNVINKILKPVHGSFEKAFFHMIQRMNDGRMDKWMLFALRSLLLSPYLGQTTVENRESNEFKEEMMTQHKFVRERAESILLDLEKRHNLPVIVCAAKKIQRYFRGWQVRRYFQARVKGHRYFDKLELQVRHVALLLASNSDSNFAFPSSSSNAKEQSELTKHLKNSKPHVIPRPPRWAVDLLEHLLREHSWLITIYPHAYSTPFHLKIKDVSGTMPGWDTDKFDDVEWIPFYRQSIFMPGESNIQFAADLTSLQSIGSEELIMEVVNNDRNERVSIMASNRLFIGRLETNNNGYTIFCYKLLSPKNGHHHQKHSKNWTLRLITPDIQNLPLVGDPGGSGESKKLCLNRFSGYYIPNDDFCICRYTIEIAHPVAYISVRFKAVSSEAVSLRLQIWDLENQKMVFEHRNTTGSFILPSIRLEQTNPRPSPHHSNSVDLVTKYLSELNFNDEDMMRRQAENNNNNGDIRRSASASNLVSKEPDIVIQKYALAIFVDDRSWPLTDGEWKFVQYETKKFWKRMMVFRDQPAGPTDSSVVETERRRQNGEFRLVSYKKNLVTNFNDLESKYEEKNPKISSKEEVKVVEAGVLVNGENNDSTPSANGKEETEQEVAIKDDKLLLDSNDLEQTEDRADVSKSENNVAEVVSIASSTGFEALENVSMSDLTSVDKTDPLINDDEKENKINDPEIVEKQSDDDFVSDDEDFVPTIVESSNLIIHQDGEDSQQIKDFSKPHWTLEIVTDADQQCTFQSNRRTFQEKLIQTKKEWENRQKGRYLQGRRLRHKFLAKHLVPIDATDADPFAFIEPMSKFYSCLYLDKSQLDGLNLEDWLPKAQTPAADSTQKISNKLEDSAKTSTTKSSSKSSKKKKNGGTNNHRKVQMKASSLGSGRKPKDGSKTSKSRGTSTPVSPKAIKSKKHQDLGSSSRPNRSKERRKTFNKKEKFESEEQVLTDNEAEIKLSPDQSLLSAAQPEKEEEGKLHKSENSSTSMTPSPLKMVELPEKKYCAPPPRGPTHILLGPDLQKCGIKTGVKGFPALDKKQLLSDIRGVVPWKKSGGGGEDDGGLKRNRKTETDRQVKEWQMRHGQVRENFLGLLQYQSFIWNHFNQHVYSNVFCDLEQNREFLEKCRHYYEETHLLRSPGRSSVDLDVKKSVQEIRDFMQNHNIRSKDLLSHSKNSLPSHQSGPSRSVVVPMTDQSQQHDLIEKEEEDNNLPSTNRTTASSKAGPYTPKNTPNLSAKRHPRRSN